MKDRIQVLSQDDLATGCLETCRDIVCSAAVRQRVLYELRIEDTGAMPTEACLTRHSSGDEVAPHCDCPESNFQRKDEKVKVAGMVIYLALSCSPLGWGTALYEQLDDDKFACRKIVPYVLNHGVILARSDSAWHGMEKIAKTEFPRLAVICWFFSAR